MRPFFISKDEVYAARMQDARSGKAKIPTRLDLVMCSITTRLVAAALATA